MKISNTQMQNVIKAYGQQGNGKNKPSKGEKSGTAYFQPDSFVLSSQGKELQAAAKGSRFSQDVRMELVQELKGKVEKGQYTVDGQEVAQKMIERIIADYLR